MKRIFTTIQKSAKNILLLTAVLAGAMASCDSVLDFEEGDCSIEYRVNFKYDYNMKKVDAFATQVKSVTLYAFDKKGTFVTQKTESGNMLSAGNYSMSIDLLPGEYEFITWAGLDEVNRSLDPVVPQIVELTGEPNPAWDFVIN